jgi:tetratricopeptide (TPR) repeat protein
LEEQWRDRPSDPAVAVRLADVLLRQARATFDTRPAGRASEILNDVLKEYPAQYDTLRMMGATYLSLHRFREALQVGRRARDLRPEDPWNYGVMGDASLELGDYDGAFEAFDTMVAMRPGAPAYARAAYARELKGDLPGALRAMDMAAQATSSEDAEAQAWHAVQLGDLHLKLGQLDQADREYRRAVHLFAGYPSAIIGRGRVQAARGDWDGALATFLDQLKRTATLDLAARVGDVYARRGRVAEAERYYQLAEDLAGPDKAQTEATLALFLAERNRRLPDAVTIAETVATVRHDIFTEDALAWSYYKIGHLDPALEASQRALRTGTRDERIRMHAAQIQAAQSDLTRKDLFVKPDARSLGSSR